MNRNKASIFGVAIDPISITKLHQSIKKYVMEDQHALILNVNVHCLNLAYERDWLKDFLNSADVTFCDGFGVILGAKLLGINIPGRITFADWTWQFAEFVEKSGFKFFFLGARPNVAVKAADKLKARYPELQIVGTHHGYFDKIHGSAENEAVIEQINSVKPNILIVGFGMPLQERWLRDNWDRIDANVALTGGAVFDYVSGNLQRAPCWMVENGLEWLGRLIIEPRRLWKRYLLGNPLFLLRIFKQKLGLISIE